MAKPVQGRRCPATVSAPRDRPEAASEPGARSTSQTRCHDPRVKGNGITMALARFRSLLTPLLAVLLLLLAACGQTQSTTFSSIGAALSPGASPSAAASVSYPLTLTDDAGRTVTLAAAPKRIVSLAPSNTEIVCALGACGELTGVTDFDDYPPSVKS